MRLGEIMRASFRLVATVGLCAIAAVVYAATALRFGGEQNVSQTATPTEKAKVVRLAYLHDGTFKKVWLFTYGDGPAGQQNVYARHSFDEGATWSSPILLSRDAANAPTGGQPITARDGLGFVVDNEKPSIFAPPVTTGPAVVIAWNSAYCPPGSGATNNAGTYVNAAQGASDFDGDGTPDLPFHCIWVATSTDPALMNWNVQQLTGGERYAMNEVIAGSSAGNAYAMVWQEDPAGLQPGEAEGRGDGGMGSHATGGTNIWYTHAPSPSGTTLRSNVAKLSDNNTLGTGEAGASRPALALSGTTAVVAYEETACPGGNGGKCVIYHSFNYSAHDANYSGNIVSDVTRHARRARVFLQGASIAGASNLRTVLMWRESPVATMAAPADIVVRRGTVDTLARPGSNGFTPADVLAEPPQYLTNVAATGGNANAHRAVLRGSFVGVAYDLTPSMDGANPEKTPVPTANYNLFFTRSLRSGEAGSWTAPLNLSGIESPTLTVVEPRMVPTPGTLINPLTGTPDAGDLQNPNVLYASFATETNTPVGAAGRIYISRSTDQGETFERFVPVSGTTAGQSEAQLRPVPDGSSVVVLWMGEQAIGDATSKDTVFAAAATVPLANLGLAASAASFPAGGQATATLEVRNHGAGSARDVVVSGSLPAGLVAIGISEPPSCSIDAASFRCAMAEIAPGQSRIISMTIGSAVEGAYSVNASAASEYLDADPADNSVALALTVTAAPPTPPPPPPAPPPEPPPSPTPVPPPIGSGGGGCTTAAPGAPFDATLLLIAGLALLGPATRRSRSAKAAEPEAQR
jgi:hypothetical protein